MLNSVLAMSGAGLGTLFLSRLIVKQWSVYRVIGGMLAGEGEGYKRACDMYVTCELLC